MDYFNSSDFRVRAEALMKEHHLPGFAIALVHDETIASQGLGLASLDLPKPFTADTLIDIASVSKSLTAASVALLVEDENHLDVKWNATMSSLLPEDFVMSGEGYTEGVTVEDILSHRSGLPSHGDSYLGNKAKNPDTPQSVTRNLRNLAVAAPIRSTYMYCNIMYTVATHLVEVKSGLSFSDFLEKHFFKPLDMTSTCLQPSQAQARGLEDRISAAHQWDEAAQTYRTCEILSTPEAQGAGSIITSVNDYIKYVKALIKQEAPFSKEIYEGLIRTRTIINPDSKFLEPHTSPDLYAVGWEIQFYRGHMLVQHSGGIQGISTHHFFLPEFKFGGVLFSNEADGDKVINVLVHELIDDLLKVPQSERHDWNKKEEGENRRYDSKKAAEEARQKLCPGIKDSQPHTLPLSTYTGKYFNVGYHELQVEVRDGELYVDATDRSDRPTLSFEHVCDQTKFIVHIGYGMGNVYPFRAEFVLENGVAVRVGMHFEEDLEEYIWFDRVDGCTSA